MFMQVSGSYTKLVRVHGKAASTLANSKEAAYVQDSKSKAHVLTLCAHKLKATNGGALDLNLLTFGPEELFSQKFELSSV